MLVPGLFGRGIESWIGLMLLLLFVGCAAVVVPFVVVSGGWELVAMIVILLGD